MIELKKIAMLRKKLTVRTLSFMMAAGLLLLIVPFVALASGKEEPNPGKKGDFRLLKGIYSTTQIDLAKEDQNDPIVTADITASSYEWQAYSNVEGKYKKFSGDRAIAVTESLAKKYDYGDGKSYFRCLATTEDERLLISDVLTVVLPAEESDPSQAEGETIATIDLLDSTQPEETEPTDSGEATTEPAQETTEPAQETTEPTTAPTQPAVDNGEKAVPAEDDDPIEGQFLKPMEDDTDDEDDLPPIRGMLLEPLGDAQTTYTVVYYVQKPIYTGNDNDTSNYEIFDYKTFDANQGDTVDLSGEMPGTTFDTFLTLNTNVSTTTGTVAADGSSVFHLYYTRQDFTFTIARGSGNSNIVLSTRRGRVTVNRANPYVFTVKYGESLVGLWPTDDMLTTRPSGFSRYLNYIRKDTSSYYHYSDDDFYSAPTVLDTSLVTKLRKRLASDQTNFPMHFVFTYDSTYRYAQYFFQKADGSWGTYPDFTIKGKNNSVFENCPTYEGFYPPSVPSSGNTRRIEYTRKQFTLSFVSNDDETTVRSATYYFEQPLVDPGEPDDADFLGWYYDSGLTQSVNWGADTMPARDITVYGKWQTTVSTHTLTVKYLDDQGTEQNQSPITYNHNDSVPEPAKSWTGHTFVNWTYEDGTAVTWPVTMDGDKTVVAHWTLDTHTLTVHKNNPDEADPAPIANVEYGTTLSTAGVTAPTRTGYDFEGWYTDAALTSKINNWQSYQVTDNLDIYANWVIKTFVVKFYNDERVNVDDNIIISYTVEYDKTIPSYTGSDPQYYGAQPKRFDKWMYDNNGTPTEFRFGTDGTHVRENMTVYGTWINTYTVTFLKDQGLSANNPNNVQFTSDPVDENATLARPAGMTDPTKDGYTFKNEWYYDVEGTPTEFVFEGTEGKTATPITSDLIVYPAWLKNEVNLTITNNGLFDNVFKITSASPAYYLEVFVPAGQSQTVTHLPFGRYSVSASNWDFRNSYNVTNGSINASSATPGQRFDVSATSNSRGFNWLGGNASSIDNRFNPFTGS